jgi:hypothetical protein
MVQHLIDERSPLIVRYGHPLPPRGLVIEDEASSIVGSCVSKLESEMGHTAVGERLPYNDYTTIDFLHDLVINITLSL